MGSTAKKVNQAGLVLSALAVIGFIGVIWLMIYGNLSGNLGFQDGSSAIINESIDLGVVNGLGVISDATNENFVSWNATVIYNATIGAGQGATNETLVEGTHYQIFANNGSFGNLTDTWNSTFTSYNVVRQADGEINSEAVISNITGGFGTFFGFSNTFFTIAAILLLIFMLIGLLALVMTIAKGRKGKSSGYQ